MSLRSTFPKFLELEENYGSVSRGLLRERKEMLKKAQARKPTQGSRRTFFMSFKNGMQELADAVVEKLSAERIILGKEVMKVKSEDGSYRVILEDGRAIEARSVIITAPTYAAAEILDELDPELSKKLQEIPYSSSATLVLGFKKRDFGHPLKGFGLVVPWTEKRKIMAMTWTSSKRPSRAPEGYVLVRAFMGGALGEENIRVNDEILIKTALDEMQAIMGVRAEPVISRIFRWEKSMPQYTVGHEARVAYIESRLSQLHPGLFVVGAAFHGVGVGDCIREGREAARQALQRIC
jgi:oxygen-dependent protoporphyrinogen oxidase